MKDIPTNELENELKNIGPKEIKNYFDENKDYLADDKKAFTYYMKDVIDRKNINHKNYKIKLKDIYSFAGISEKYGEKIMNMQAHTKNRDLILRLCLAGRFTIDEINRALKLYGMNPLYAKDKRDACIIVAINNKKYYLYEIDDILEKYGFLKLSKDE